MIPLHPLHDPDFLHSTMRITGCYPEIARRTGRTTIQILRVLAVAMENPGRWVAFQDHHGTTEASRYMLNTMQTMAAKLGFEHLHYTYVAQGGAVVFHRGKPPPKDSMNTLRFNV